MPSQLKETKINRVKSHPNIHFSAKHTQPHAYTHTRTSFPICFCKRFSFFSFFFRKREKKIQRIKLILAADKNQSYKTKHSSLK